MEVKNARYEIEYRSNDGENHTTAATGLDDAKKKAKSYRSSENYMVCITEDGGRVLRWDREPLVGENSWSAVDPDEFETLGPLRSVIRSV